MTLIEALALKDREVISLVGAGGKTTLMFTLGKELSSQRKGILLTTTTKIREPVESAQFALFLSDQFSETARWVKKNSHLNPCLLIARGKIGNGKLQGIPPQWIEEFRSLKEISVIIVEADGAAGRSLKAPREGEPVVPQSTSLLIPVVGIDVLGCPLNEEYVFRSEIAARLLNLAIGSKVTEEGIAALLAEISKSHPPQARIIPFINKVDIPDGLEKARKLARYLLHIDRGQIERVILGQAQGDPVVKEIIFC